MRQFYFDNWRQHLIYDAGYDAEYIYSLSLRELKELFFKTLENEHSEKAGA